LLAHWFLKTSIIFCDNPRNLVVGHFAIKKPGFFGKAGLLLAKLTHYPKSAFQKSTIAFRRCV